MILCLFIHSYQGCFCAFTIFNNLCFFVFYTPNILGHADNYIEANPPFVTPAHIVPEWYLLPFYAIWIVPDKLMGVTAMFSAILILAALPWLDTSKVRSAVFRPLYKQFYWILVLDVLILGYVGAMPAEGLYLLLARLLLLIILYIFSDTSFIRIYRKN